MAKLYWSGDVGWIMPNGSGITVESVKADLDSLDGADLEVELTTLGGDFFQAAPIMNLVRSYKGKKTLWLSGIVASAGTVIAMGFDKIIARSTSMFMIHNAQSMAWGDHNDMREAADLYERMSNTIAEEYVARTGKTLAQIKAWMDAETWFMGQEIVDAGFANEIETDVQQKATGMMLISAQNEFRERVTMWAKRKPEESTATRSTVEALIESGSVDKSTDWNKADDSAALKLENYPYGKEGKVYRSALRRMASVAANDKNPELAAWAGVMLKKIDAKGETRVNKETVLAWLKDNPGCADEVAAAMGLKLVTNSVTVAVELKAKLDAENIADPLAEIKRLRTDLEKVDVDKVTNALDAEFGPEKTAEGTVNNLRVYAGQILAGVKSAELSAKVEEFKKNPIALKLAGERMDANSDQNLFGRHESGEAHKPDAWLKTQSMVL